MGKYPNKMQIHRYYWEHFCRIAIHNGYDKLEKVHIMSTLRKLFLDHPAAVDESYFEHLIFAFKFAGRLFRIGFAALVHGVVPSAFETIASNEVLTLSDEIRSRRQRMATANATVADGHSAI
jgi:Family of unknown function (DUF6356)